MRIILATLLLFLVACSSSHSTLEFQDPVKVTANVSLLLPFDMNKAEVALLVSAAKITTAEFERTWGAIHPPVDVYAWRGESIPCGQKKGRFGGCHYGFSGPIHVIVGPLYTMPSLYHEFVHHMTPYDTGHQDQRWPLWNLQRDVIIRRIQRKRIKMNLYKIKYNGKF